MKIAVVGIGGTGSAAARHLAKAGHDVVGYERFQIGHTHGSSHGESRIIRYTYSDPLYTRLMREAYPEWETLERESEEELFVRCGGLTFGPTEHPDLIATEQSLIDADLPYDRLSPQETHDRFHAVRIANGETALYQRDSGFLRASRCVMANARLARQYGAQFYEETIVTKIHQHGNQVLVRTNRDNEELFDRVIVTAGAWMGQLFAHLQLPLSVTRQQIVYLNIRQNPETFEPGTFPIWIDVATNYYGFPSDGQIPGVKLASHNQGDPADPDQPRRPVDQDYLDQAIAYTSHRLPDLGPDVTWSQTCLYTNAPNEDFIMDTVPEMPLVSLVSGCSGHGFKFTALLGKIAAEMATNTNTHRDLSRFRLANAKAPSPA